MRILNLTLMSLMICLFGCSTITPSKSAQCLFLSSPQKRDSGLTTFHFPGGVYRPDFESETGIYYVAPTKIISEAVGVNLPMRGGIYIPHANSVDQTQAGWVDHQEGGGGLVGFAATSNTRLWPFTPPVNFEYVKEKPGTLPEGYMPAEAPASVAPK